MFGGDGAVPRTESLHDSEDDGSQGSVRQSPPVADNLSLQDAQDAQTIDQLLESDADDNLYTDSDVELEDHTKKQPTRPSRFTGPPQTWKGYTADDRHISTSLDQIQDSDLAAHLYNAHALKSRVRRSAEDLAGLKSWQGRDTWLKTGKDLQYTDVSGLNQTELVPSKDWTAWPLSPSKLMDGSTRSRRNLVDGDSQEWSIGNANSQDVGDELRDELLAGFLRLAKDQWNSRDVEDEFTCNTDNTAVLQSRLRSKSLRSTTLRRSASRPDVKMKDSTGPEGDDADGRDDDKGEMEESTVGKKRGRRAQDEIFGKPTILADDTRAQRLLQPTIHSMLGRLDDLALAVRRTRLNHFGRGDSYDTSSQNDLTTDAESTGLGSRSPSRTPSKRRSKSIPSTKSSPRTRSKRLVSGGPRNRGTNEGRDEISKRASASTDISDSDTTKEPSPRKRPRSESTASEESASTSRDWSTRAGLMDWSEVLGLAAVRGWDEQAVARTAQRCAALFGESMSFMPLDESSTPGPVAEPVQYTPSVIPGLDVPPISGPPKIKRPFFQVGTLRCPHTDCFGHDRDFALPYRVVEHCIRVHDYDPRTNDSANEERTVGGVHNDGFLQPVTVKPGWLGHGRSKANRASKKLKTNPEDEASGSEAAGLFGE